MRKMILVILILSLLLPVAAVSDVSEWLYEGTWTNTQDGEDGIALITVSLWEDGKAYYVAQTFSRNEPGIGRAFVGSWEVTGPDTIHVIVGENTSMDLRYCTFNMMLEDKTRRLFFRAEMRDGDNVGATKE